MCLVGGAGVPPNESLVFSGVIWRRPLYRAADYCYLFFAVFFCNLRIFFSIINIFLYVCVRGCGPQVACFACIPIFLSFAHYNVPFNGFCQSFLRYKRHSDNIILQKTYRRKYNDKKNFCNFYSIVCAMLFVVYGW